MRRLTVSQGGISWLPGLAGLSAFCRAVCVAQPPGLPVAGANRAPVASTATDWPAWGRRGSPGSPRRRWHRRVTGPNCSPLAGTGAGGATMGCDPPDSPGVAATGAGPGSPAGGAAPTWSGTGFSAGAGDGTAPSGGAGIGPGAPGIGTGPGSCGPAWVGRWVAPPSVAVPSGVRTSTSGPDRAGGAGSSGPGVTRTGTSRGTAAGFGGGGGSSGNFVFSGGGGTPSAGLGVPTTTQLPSGS